MARSLLTTRMLRYVLAVADELDFTKAAAKLNISPSHLRKQIRRFEKGLDAKLVAVKQKKVSLTEAGEAFVSEARQALFYIQRAVQPATAVSAPTISNGSRS